MNQESDKINIAFFPLKHKDLAEQVHQAIVNAHPIYRDSLVLVPFFHSQEMLGYDLEFDQSSYSKGSYRNELTAFLKGLNSMAIQLLNK